MKIIPASVRTGMTRKSGRRVAAPLPFTLESEPGEPQIYGTSLVYPAADGAGEVTAAVYDEGDGRVFGLVLGGFLRETHEWTAAELWHASAAFGQLAASVEARQRVISS